MAFEFNSNAFAINGNLTAEVTEPGAGGVATPTNTVIRRNSTWTLKIKWNIEGTINMLNGEWLLSAYLEQMGPGDAFSLVIPAPKDKFVFHPPVPAALAATHSAGVASVTANGDRVDYEAVISFNAAANSPANPGVYRLVVVLTSLGVNGLPGAFAAFVDAGLLQFYD
jgi:hypothetical protein